MKKKFLIILGVLLVLYLIGEGCSNNTSAPIQNNSSTTTAASEPAKEEAPALPESKFDATVAIPGTKLTLAYPAKGFYEKGAVVKTFQPGDPDQYGHVLSIQPEQTFDKTTASEFLTVIVSLDNASPEEKTLKTVMADLNQTSIEADAIKENGKYQAINGHEFFLFKVDAEMAFWRATTLEKNQIITVTLMYNPNQGKDSKTVSENNDRLFMEMLQKISYK